MFITTYIQIPTENTGFPALPAPSPKPLLFSDLGAAKACIDYAVGKIISADPGAGVARSDNGMHVVVTGDEMAAVTLLDIWEANADAVTFWWQTEAEPGGEP